MSETRVVKCYSIGDIRITLERRDGELQKVWLTIQNLVTGGETSRMFEDYSTGSMAFTVALRGAKGQGDDINALCGNQTSDALRE